LGERKGGDEVRRVWCWIVGHRWCRYESILASVMPTLELREMFCDYKCKRCEARR